MFYNIAQAHGLSCRRSNPQLKAETNSCKKKKKVSNHRHGRSNIIQMSTEDKFTGMKGRRNFTAASNYRS